MRKRIGTKNMLYLFPCLENAFVLYCFVLEEEQAILILPAGVVKRLC